MRSRILILSFLLAGFLGGLVVSGRLSLTQPSTAEPIAPLVPQAAADTAAPVSASPAQRAAAAAGLPDLSSIAAAALEVSANISSTTLVRVRQDPFWELFYGNRVQRSQSLGSGVVVSPDGYILTNTHVIGNAGADVRVTLTDGQERPGEIVGIDSVSDLAVVRVDAHGLPTLPWGDSSKLRVAEWVLAVGNPFQLSGTVTLGIVSTVSRSGEQVGAVQDFIQTDAAINPGNSGGALVNARGELVGINTMIYTETGGYQGIGFAIPSNKAREIMTELIQHGSVTWGSIGTLDLVMIDERLARRYGLPATGAYVRALQRNSSALRAGLELEDIITAINGREVTSLDQLERTIIAQKVGSTVTLTVVKPNGRSVQIEVPVVARRQNR